MSKELFLLVLLSKQNEFCCAVWSMSVLIAVRACCCLRHYFPEWTYHYYIFVSVKKSEIHGFGKKLHLFQLLTTVELWVSIKWVSKFPFYVAQGARENGWLPASEADARDPLLSFVNKILIMELNHKMYSFGDGLEFLLIVTYRNPFGLLNYSTLSFPRAWRNSALNRSRNENHLHPPLA